MNKFLKVLFFMIRLIFFSLLLFPVIKAVYFFADDPDAEQIRQIAWYLIIYLIIFFCLLETHYVKAVVKPGAARWLIYVVLLLPAALLIVTHAFAEADTFPKWILYFFIGDFLSALAVMEYAFMHTRVPGILCKIIDTANEWAGKVASWAAFIVVIVVFVDVVMRYAFNISFVFTQELEWHMFGFIFLIGAGATLLKDGHVRVDIFYQRMSDKNQAWVNLMGVLFFLLPGCYMIIATSLNFVYNSWAILEGSPDPGGIPYRFIIKSCIPIGFALVTAQGIALGIRSLFTVMGKEKQLDTDQGEEC